MDDSERIKLFTEIKELGEDIKKHMTVMAICFIGYTLTTIMTIIEGFRLGILDTTTVMWFVISMLCMGLMSNNKPPADKLAQYVTLVTEYMDKDKEEETED